jgi:hypothetical protein
MEIRSRYGVYIYRKEKEGRKGKKLIGLIYWYKFKSWHLFGVTMIICEKSKDSL